MLNDVQTQIEVISLKNKVLPNNVNTICNKLTAPSSRHTIT